MAVSYGSNVGAAQVSVLSVVDKVTHFIRFKRGIPVLKNGHVLFLSEVAEGFFVVRHNQTDTRGSSVADDLKVIVS